MRADLAAQIDNHVAGHRLPVLFCFRKGGHLVTGDATSRVGAKDGEECRFSLSLVSRSGQALCGLFVASLGNMTTATAGMLPAWHGTCVDAFCARLFFNPGGCLPGQGVFTRIPSYQKTI